MTNKPTRRIMGLESTVWLIFTVVLLVFEAVTATLVSIWFAIGAGVAFIVSLFLPDALLIQIVVFIVVSILMLFVTRPLAKKYMPKKSAAPTNTDRIIGRRAMVTKPIKKEKKGRVYVDGQSWAAESSSEFEIDDVCIIQAVEGVTLIVCPVKQD